MDDIKELIFLTKDQEEKITELINISSRSPERIVSFYEMLKEGQLQSDAQAAAYFFKDSANNTNYQKLKSDLLKRLTVIFFFLNVETNNGEDRRSSFHRYYFRWSVAVNLLKDGATQSTGEMLTEIYEKAKFYEFTDLCQFSAEALSYYYLEEETDIENYLRFQEEADRYEDINEKEDHAELLYSQLASERTNQRSLSDNYVQKAEKAFVALKNSISEIDTYRFRLCAYLIESGLFLAQKNYAEVNRVSAEAIDFFKQKKYDVNIPLQIFYYQKLLSHIQLQDYEEGREAAEQCAIYMEEGTYNWFKYLEARYLLLMHTDKYREALEVLDYARSHERYNFLPENIKEVWNVYTAYVSLLVKLNQIEVPAIDLRYRDYDINKMLDRVQIYSRDKEGLNISIQIIYLLHIIAEKDYELLVLRMDAVKKYSTRYMNKAENKRSQLFLKMLLMVHLKKYKPSTFQKRTEKYLEELQNIAFDISKQSAEIEIIPYEKLWKIVLGQI